MLESSNIQTIDSDRSQFFKFVFDHSLSLEDLLISYLRYHGPIFNDQRQHLRSRLDQEFGRRGWALQSAELFESDEALNVEALATWMPEISNAYFRASTTALECKELLSASANEWYDVRIPHPLNQVSAAAGRPSFSICRALEGRSLFVGPHQYQLFDYPTGRFFPKISTRRFDRSIQKLEHIYENRQVILVQDLGDGANFAHFLFDWITRIMHTVEQNVAQPHDTLFVLGGNKGPFHDLMLSILCTRYGLTDQNFLFPTQRQVLELERPLLFFSDSQLVPMHPAQMAHPKSIDLLRRLCREAAIPPSVHRKIYVTRQDAALRRIENEKYLISIARELDFHIVNMSDHSVQDQISLISGAQSVVGPHGMGLAHIAFNENPLHVMELFHPTLGTDAYSMISRAMGSDYAFIVGSDLKDGRGSYWIDPEAFRQELGKLS